MLGMPTDANSTFMQGPAQAPARIRQVLHSGSANYCAENGQDLAHEPRFVDLDDLDLPEEPGPLPQIEEAVGQLVERGVCVLALGGDHAITYPIVRAYSRRHQDLSILHFDAHPDLYEEYEGSRYSHACPMARIVEEGLAQRLVQVGVRTMTPDQQALADEHGVEVIDMRQWHPGIELSFDGPLYVSVDMDVLDPAFAPGVSHHEPGGLATRDLLRMIQNLQAPIVGADVVEFNPGRDPAGITAMGAVKLVKELAVRMLFRAAPRVDTTGRVQ
jgi:agmatinase